MKSPKLLLAAMALSISLASFSQVDTTKKDTTTKKTDTTKKKDPALTNESSINSTPAQQATVTTLPAGSATNSNTSSTTPTEATINGAGSKATLSSVKSNNQK